ncbi:MAG: hypothetical protein P4M08_10620 [Oligoflexia bacterium]|nr:hypothetical protein [Oligoflexia bacterium]
MAESQSNFSSQTHSPAHIRGERTYVSKPSRAYRILAACLDLAFAWVILSVGAIALGHSALPGWKIFCAYILFLAAAQLFRRFYGITTPGELAWDIRAARAPSFPQLNFSQAFPLKSSQLTIGTFLTTLSILAAAWISYMGLAISPIGVRAEVAEWDAFLPDSASGEDRFSVVPFYYSLGAWPSVFQGKPVFFNFPYEKGPPTHFAGRIQARWSVPADIRLTFEGPKTPYKATQLPYSRADVRNCTVSFWNSPVSAISCLTTREAVLGRHLDALSAQGLGKPQLTWVHVSSKALAPEDQLQGFYLSAQGPTRGQDRFVMLTPRGTEQAFILDYPMSIAGDHARAVFKEAIRSLRVSDSLEPGRTWIDQSIERIHLSDLEHASEQEIPARLAEVQEMLIARISIDPKTYDGYFHLGGTAVLLARHAAKIKSRSTSDADAAAEWLTLSKPLIESTWKYATDLAPKDPRTGQLHAMLVEVQRL